MEFNLSTFILEIINFLVLVWILKRFLYKPVLEAIAQRKESIDKSLADAQSLHAEAEVLQKKYANRLTHWEQEKRAALDALHQEIEKERTLRMEKLEQQITEERKRTEVIAERHLQTERNIMEKQALEQGARFASALLKQAAGPELENRLFDLLLEKIAGLSALRIQSLRNMNGQIPEYIRISSAFNLDSNKRTRLEQALNRLTHITPNYIYQLDPALIAGFRISIGPWLLQTNVQSELTGFVEIGNVAE